MLRYVIFLSLSLLFACSIKENKEIDVKNKKLLNDSTGSNNIKKIDWKNPMLNPSGTDLVRMIRAYFLVGDISKVSSFVILPKDLSLLQFESNLKNSAWGYEMNVTNVHWKSDRC